MPTCTGKKAMCGMPTIGTATPGKSGLHFHLTPNGNSWLTRFYNPHNQLPICNTDEKTWGFEKVGCPLFQNPMPAIFEIKSYLAAVTTTVLVALESSGISWPITDAVPDV